MKLQPYVSRPPNIKLSDGYVTHSWPTFLFGACPAAAGGNIFFLMLRLAPLASSAGRRRLSQPQRDPLKRVHVIPLFYLFGQPIFPSTISLTLYHRFFYGPSKNVLKHYLRSRTKVMDEIIDGPMLFPALTIATSSSTAAIVANR